MNAMSAPACRWCTAMTDVVLDLGHQPAADHFPRVDDPGPDPVYPLRMVLCRACGLAQLAEDSTAADEPRAIEPQALRDQAVEAVSDLVGGGLLAPGMRVREFGSPHGGSWEDPLTAAGLTWCCDATPHGPTDAVVDVFGLMHEADQRVALARRGDAVRPGGMLLLQFHSLAAILAGGQWNALRHGHFAYYSTPALVHMAADLGWSGVGARTYPLYGGTVLLALRRAAGEAREVRALRETESTAGVGQRDRMAALGEVSRGSARALRRFLLAEKAEGRLTLGYGAASRAVALLTTAGVDADLLPAVADASTAKHGRALPGSRVPVISPTELVAARPHTVLVLVPDLVGEVRRALPEVEAGGGRWVVVAPVPVPISGDGT